MTKVSNNQPFVFSLESPQERQKQKNEFQDQLLSTHQHCARVYNTGKYLNYYTPEEGRKYPHPTLKQLQDYMSIFHTARQEKYVHSPSFCRMRCHVLA